MEKINYSELVHRCFRCGYCKFPSDYSDLNCPSYATYRFETYFSGGRMWLLRGWLKGEIEWSEHLGEIMYSCTTCKNCVEHCVFKFRDKLVDIFVSARSDMVENGLVPRKVAEFFNNVSKFGNPWGQRYKPWTEKIYDGNEYLLHAGCIASFDSRAKKALKALEKVLNYYRVDFGVLSDERCEGNEVLIMGEFGLFEELAKRNIQKFTKLGVWKILTPDPHAYNAIKNYYPTFGFDAEVYHHTQIIDKLLKDVEKLDLKVTYHDPCFLGRWNGIYKEPRRILNKVARFIEMPRNKDNAFCCGGGSGNFFTDYLGNVPAKIRVKEAEEVADVLVTACPVCLTMLESATEKIEVLDIAEIVLEALRDLT